MGIKIHCPEKFRLLYNLPEDTSIVILIGGRGGMKTYEASKFAAIQATIKGKRVQIVRDEKTNIRETILNEVLQRYDTANEGGVLSQYFERLETGIKRKANDSKGDEMVVFTKGLRASSNDKKANLKGDSNVDISIIEEAEDLRDEKKFNLYSDGLRKQGSFIIIILNTPDVGHWIIKRFFNIIPLNPEEHPGIEPKELEGYYDIEPKKIKGFVSIRSSWHENEHLPEKTRESYKGYGQKGSSNYDLHHYLTSICGYTSTGRKGQYLKIKQIISLDEFLAVEAREIYGQDFGTTSPAGLIRVKMIKNRIYVDELNYLGLHHIQLAYLYDKLGLNQSSIIIADSAEPESIGRLRRGIADLMTDEEKQLYPNAAKGFHGISPVGNKSIKDGLTLLQGMEIYVTERSVNLQVEIANYIEAVDRNGVGIGVPIDDYNHCFVGETLITTDKGLMRIDSINGGDKVLTSQGYRSVLHRFNNGVKKVNKYLIHCDTFCVSLICTENHLIKIQELWTPINLLKEGQKIHLHTSSIIKPTTFMKAKNIIVKVVKDFIELFGSSIMGKYLKDLMYTTTTVLQQTIGLKTLNLLRKKNTTNCTVKNDLQKTQNLQKNFNLKESQKHQNGTEAKQDINGIAKPQSDKWQIENPFQNSVLSVGNRTKQKQYNSQLFTVTKIVKCEPEGNDLKQVYDLMVSDTHEYYANGVLVHNCIDPLRYVAVSKGRLF